MGAYGGPQRSLLYSLPPYITATGPADGQVRVPYDSPLWLSFSQPMNPVTVSYQLSDPAIILDSAWSQGHDTLYLTHSQNFVNFTQYNLRIISGHGQSGQPLAPVPGSFSFKTQDTVRPRLVTTQPYHGQTGVATNALIRLWFSKAVNKNNLAYTFSDTSYHFTLYQTNDSVITLGHVGHPFVGGTTYTLEITSFQDSVGNTMGQSLVPNPFSFTTVGTGVEEASVMNDGLPDMFFLAPAWPNPSRTGGKIRFEFLLNEEGMVELNVYDILGKARAEVFQGHLSKGRHMIIWNGCDLKGMAMAAGVYFYRLRVGEKSAMGRLTIVR